MTAKRTDPPKRSKSKGSSPRGDRPKEAPPSRLEQVEGWLGAGVSYSDAVQLATTTLQISRRTAERDIARIYLKWEEEEKQERPARRARMRGELWDLYGEARRLMKLHEEGGGDDVEEENEGGSIEGGEGVMVATLRVRKRRLPRPKDCLDAARILERLAKLDGLEAPVKLEVKGSDVVTEGVLAMTPQEREKRIAELMAKRDGKVPKEKR